MSESLPRWNLPEIDFIETNPDKIKSEVICNFETVSGRTLAIADPVRLFLLSIANIIIHQRSLINIAAKNNLLSYATGDYLDALGSYLQVNRLGASSATAIFSFTLSEAFVNDYVIQEGTQITNGVVTFSTSESLTIPAGEISGSVIAYCTVSGEIGNGYLAGQITTLVQPLVFVSSVTNTETTQGGSPSESDEDYAERIKLAPNAFSVAGPKKAYEFHTYSVSPNIIDVSVYSPSPGVVNVYPLLNGGEIPNAALLENVSDYLSADNRRPMTDNVNALAATAVDYVIRVKYYIRREDKVREGSIQAAVIEAVEKYRLWQQSKIGRDIIPAELVRSIMNAGACRISNEEGFSMLPYNYVELNQTEVAQCPSANVTIIYGGLVDG